MKLEKVSIRKVSQKGTSLAVTLPKGWAEQGDKVCVSVKNEDTLIVSKKLV